MKAKLHLFLVRATVDAGFGLTQAVVPLLALKYGASAILLGAVGWVAMTVRLPFCLLAGPLSEKVGRKTVAIPAAVLLVSAPIGLILAHSSMAVLAFYALLAIASGAFHPSVQAFVGDLAPPGHLGKNLGAFNLGWCGSLAAVALLSGWLVGIELTLPLYVAAGLCLATCMLVVFWRGHPGGEPNARADEITPPACDPRVLLVSRIGHFAGFVGFAVIRILFPKLGEQFGWTDQQIAETAACSLGGVALGLLVANLSSWWHGKFWPQVAAQCLLFISGAVAVFSSQQIPLAVAFFGVGVALGVANTAALYHGLSDHKQRGKNAGIHESLVSAAHITGCLLGGVLAEAFGPRASLVFFCGVAGLGVVATLAIYYARFARIVPAVR